MSARVLWVVQSNLGNPETLARFDEVCARLGVACHPVQVIPFSDELPDITWDGPTIFYGATGFITKAFASGRFHPCAFFDLERFRFSYWQRLLRAHLLNDTALQTTLAAFGQSARDPESLWFIRPDRDSKVFAGEVVRFADVRAWAERLSAGGFTFGDDEPIVVAEPRNILREWRLFMVDGRVSAASRYREGSRLSISPEVPAEVRAFGEARAREAPIAPVFVLDIAETRAGLSVIEINCFNSSGFYAADLLRIVADVSALVEARWG